MTFTLRDYQQRASDAGVKCLSRPAGKCPRNGLIVLPTGSGKSLVIADIARKISEPILVFQPSKEILEQNLEKLRAFGGQAEVFSASMGRKDIHPTGVTFATIGSVHRRIDEFRHFRKVIIDECHLVNSYGGMYDTFLRALGATCIGMTATPYRLASNSFGSQIRFITRMKPRIFNEVIHVTNNRELFNAGHLSKLEYYAIPGFDARNLKVNSTGAEYAEDRVLDYMKAIGFSMRLHDVVSRVAAKRRAVLVFTQTVKDARDLSVSIPNAAMVSADTPKSEREQIGRAFRSGSLKVVANVGVFNVGFDYPELDAVILGSPTLSLALYYQRCGRCVRPHAGKASAWVVDMCENTKAFGRIEDLRVCSDTEGRWIVENRGRQLTNVYRPRGE